MADPQIDWSLPLETTDGRSVRLLTDAEMGGAFGGTNPDCGGDYWVKDAEGCEWCIGPNGGLQDGADGEAVPTPWDVRNVASS